MFKTIGFQIKLVGGFALVLFISGVVGITGYNILNKVVHVTDTDVMAMGLEMALGKTLALQEKYKHSGTQEDYDAIQKTVADIGAEETLERSNSVAASAEEISRNMESVAAATEESAVNINSMATATEEMTSTIDEIA